VFVTLFNLQGAHRSAAAGFDLTTLSSLCQELFSSFLNFFVLSFAALRAAVAVATISHLTTSASLCQELFSTFFKVFSFPTRPSRFRCPALADSLDIITPVFPFVKRFIRFF
jgi:hypothetical protein